MNPQLASVNAVLGQAGFGGRERALDRQSQMADELRNAPMPGMHSNARVQTAASPLEFAAAGLSRVGGQAMADRTEAKRQAMFDDRMRRLRGDIGVGTPTPSSGGGMDY
jgi:hypothetical protein